MQPTDGLTAHGQRRHQILSALEAARAAPPATVTYEVVFRVER